MTDEQIKAAVEGLPSLAGPLSAGEKANGWEIDRTTESPILTYEKCSVIQDDQAVYVMKLIQADRRAALSRPHQQDQDRNSPSE